MVVRDVGMKATDEPVAVTQEDLLDSFLDGLGISRAELDPSVKPAEMLVTAGLVLRELVKGTTELLASRANLKNSFRLDQTTILPRQNNPMKFSANTNDLLKQLLIESDGAYLGAQDAISEVCRDLVFHQNAFLDAMNSAISDFADRFEPEELQDGFDRTMGKNLFGMMDKAKYWELYCELYPIITEKGGGRFPQMFSEDFVKAYEEQIAECRAQDDDGTAVHKHPETLEQPDDEDLIKTRTFNAPILSAETAFEDDDIVDNLSKTGISQIDPGFLEDLEKSLAEDDPRESIDA
jgi:predicted component of type VI protein secretion system